MDFSKSTRLLFVLLACTAPLISSSEAPAPNSKFPPVGGWFPIKDVTDPHIVAIGKFAVEEQGKKTGVGRQFIFAKVVTGEEQIVSGRNYRLLLLAALGNGFPKKYQAVVYENLKQEKTLISFHPIVYA